MLLYFVNHFDFGLWSVIWINKVYLLKYFSSQLLMKLLRRLKLYWKLFWFSLELSKNWARLPGSLFSFFFFFVVLLSSSLLPSLFFIWTVLLSHHSFLPSVASATTCVPQHHGSCLSWKMRNSVLYIISAWLTWGVCNIVVSAFLFSSIYTATSFPFYYLSWT